MGGTVTVNQETVWKREEISCGTSGATVKPGRKKFPPPGQTLQRVGGQGEGRPPALTSKKQKKGIRVEKRIGAPCVNPLTHSASVPISSLQQKKR